jgi:hypothetical protein
MMRLIPLLPLILAGCAATADGEWPSLARRPGEIETGARAEPVAAAPTVAAPAAAPAPPDATVVTAAARVADIAREFAEVSARWARQRATTDAALAAARSAAADTPAWSTAQLELTRLERLGATMGELGDRTNAVAGDLAQASAAGSDVKVALDSAGVLLGRIETARAEHLTLFETAQRALQR